MWREKVLNTYFKTYVGLDTQKTKFSLKSYLNAVKVKPVSFEFTNLLLPSLENTSKCGLAIPCK